MAGQSGDATGAAGIESLEDAFDCDRALVFGIGGGGDVVGTVPTARLLERHGVDVILGGIPWERAILDPTPGPFPLADLNPLEGVSDTVGLATAATRSVDGVDFAESQVAAHYDEAVAMVDITPGPATVAAGIAAACDALDLDLVVGVDAGGDALARGHEPGIRSPIADAIGVATLDALSTPSMLGVYGWGSDGELTQSELEGALAAVADRGGLLGAWGLTPQTVSALEGLLETVETEASRLPVEAARGGLGKRTIRDGTRTLHLTAASTVTYYLDPGAVAAVSDPVARVGDAESLDAAHRALRDADYVTELAIERGEVDPP
jgi:hypothetical protein